jgi:hypothetical protein
VYNFYEAEKKTHCKNKTEEKPNRKFMLASVSLPLANLKATTVSILAT